MIDGLRAAGSASARWTLDGEEYLNFAGCGHLALAGLPEVRTAASAALSGGAPFSQQMPAAYGVVDARFEAVESAAADAMGTETSVYFASGYLIGMIGLAAFSRAGDHLFLDSGAHDNLSDAARLSRRPVTAFAHWEPDALAAALRAGLGAGERPLVLTDGTSTVTGELAPLVEFAEVLAPYDGRILADDSHGFGVVGDQGRGAAEHLRVEPVVTTAGTLSKAYCASGAVVGCARATAGRVRRVSAARRANAGSPLSAAVGEAALRYMSAHPERRVRLSSLTARLRAGLRDAGLDVAESPAPIVAFRTGDRDAMRSLRRRLFARRIHVPISNYRGPDGAFRCSVFADHTIDDLDTLVDAITT